MTFMRAAFLCVLSLPALAAPVPPDAFFTQPQFTTRAELACRGGTQEDVEAYVSEIVSNRFPCGVFVLDADWMAYPGACAFDREAFPQPEQMLARIHAQGWKVLMGTSYCVSPDSKTCRALRARGVLMPAADTNGVALVSWRCGQSAAWNLSDTKALGLLADRLLAFSERYGIDGYFFEAPEDVLLNNPAFARNYGRLAQFYPYAVYDDDRVLGSAAAVLRLSVCDDTWPNLRKIIPAVLRAHRAGKRYCVVEGMGNAATRTRLDPKLYVRACALQALLPMMSFSVAPWRVLPKEHCAICRALVRLHLTVAPYILQQVRTSAATGVPVVRSLAEAFPQGDYAAYTQQFMLGEKYLVAPVVREDDSLTLAIPPGTWKDPRGLLVVGPRVLTLTHVPLSFLPYFERQ